MAVLGNIQRITGSLRRLCYSETMGRLIGKSEREADMRKQSMEQLKKAGKIIGKMISILSIIFIIYAIWKLGFDFQSIHNWYLFLAVSLVCVIVKCVTVYLSGMAWACWLHFFAGKKIDRREAVCVYAKANIGKYLPGNVMHYVERNLFATNLGISQKKLAVSVSAGQLVQSIRLIFGESYVRIILGVIAVGLAAVLAAAFLLRKKLTAQLKEYSLKEFGKTLAETMVLYGIVLIALGLIMVALYAYMGGEITWNNGSLIVSGYVIAWVLGFVIPGASGGIGVRELVITVLLGSVVGAETVLTLSVIHRLITIVGDFLAYLVMLIIRKV